jgi:hypothetical protein
MPHATMMSEMSNIELQLWMIRDTVLEEEAEEDQQTMGE